MAVSWKLERYARYVISASGGHWQYFDNQKDELIMTLTDTSHLILCQGKTVLESLSLSTSRAWMRGMVKTDSMLLMYKVKNETRRFRVKFNGSDDVTGKQFCDDCLEKLANYFPIKTSSIDPQAAGNSNTAVATTELVKDVIPIDVDKRDDDNVKTLSGDVTLGQLAEVVTGKVKADLPAAYQQCDISQENISMMVRLCLTDPTFPAFVESVEKELHKIIEESKT